MNMIATMYETKMDLLCFDDRLPIISSKFRELYKTFIKESYFSFGAIRNYLTNHGYALNTQDILEVEGLTSNITLLKRGKIIGWMECMVKKDALEITILTCKKIKRVRVIILHLICVYPKKHIYIYMKKKIRKAILFCEEIGFKHHETTHCNYTFSFS
jgi:hypothetical protein